jgi:hypothetical protein
MNKIIICLPSPSIKELEDNIESFKNVDCQWASLNRFKAIEENILYKIKKRLDVVYCSSPERFSEGYKNIKDFKGLLITNSQIARQKINGIYNENKKVYVSDWGYGFSSLFAMICALIKLKYKQIFLFGAQGYAENTENVYYSQYKFRNENFKARKNSIYRDTKIMNKHFYELLDYWGIETKDVDIYNVTQKTKIDCFRKISIPQCLKYLA